MTDATRGALDAFNALPAQAARDALLACCASAAFAAEVAGRRPYADAADLHAASAGVLARLDWPDVQQALAAHPRIGERATGDGRNAAWSRGEQAGMDGADAALRREIAAGNRAYEAKFGHVHLVCATGLGAGALLAALRARLGNDPAAERAVVRTELAKITALRLDRLLTTAPAPPSRDHAPPSERAAPDTGPPPGPAPTLSTHVLDAAAGRPAAGTPVTLERRDAAGEWRRVAAAATDEDGRVRSFGTATPPGAYRLVFDCAGRSPFFPEVSVAFVLAAGGHFHVPLLLSPFAYSTYRGS